MPCFYPQRAWRTEYGEVTFNRHQGATGEFPLPCGRCRGCRLRNAQELTIRCLHEAQLSRENCFLTLTYNDEHLPPGNTLVLLHAQKFIRALRDKTGATLRYLLVGEYGDKENRAHYHALIFGYDPPDKILHTVNRGNRLFRSEIIESVWRYGFSTVGELNAKSVAYCARYAMKKQGGKREKKHYESIDPETGEVHQRKPEFSLRSLRPGLGGSWLDLYTADVYAEDDGIIHGGKKWPIPRYYDKLFERSSPQNKDAFAQLKEWRQERSIARAPDNTPERLVVREKCLAARMSKLKRDLA